MAEIRVNATGGLKLYDADDSHYAQIVAGTITSNTDVMTLGHAAVVMGTKLDMNGSNLVLDADADTYLDTGTDDTIKFYVSGAHDLTIGANAINVLSGTTLTIDSGATITNSGTANGFSSADPASADGDTLGTASAEWSDLYLADGGVVYFGNDQEITLTHSADSGLLLKHTATADDKPINLVLQTGETDMAADDVIGKISWQAPDEGTGTDAILVSAAIQAVAEGNYSSASNATRLEFMTADSEAATEKMTLTSAGILNTTKLGVMSDHDLGDGIHIKQSDSSADVHSNADQVVIERNDACGLSILSATNNSGNIMFGDSGDNDIGSIIYMHNGNYMAFTTNAQEQMRIHDTGVITMPYNPGVMARNNGGETIAHDSAVTVTWDTENADRNADFTSNTFTAPNTGLYKVSVGVVLDLGTTPETHVKNGYVDVIASNRSIKLGQKAYYSNHDDRITIGGSCTIDMDTNDTLTTTVVFTRNSGTGTAVLLGNESCFLSIDLIS